MGKTKLPWESPKIQRDLRKLKIMDFCAKYGVSVPAVSWHRRLAGVARIYPNRLRPPRGLAKEIERHSLGFLAKKHGVGTTIVSRWLTELGVDAHAARVRRLYGGADRLRARDRAARLHHQGRTAREIGAELKMSAGKANQLLHEAGISRLPPQRVTRMGAMAVLRAAGFSLEQIGQAFSLTRERVRQILDRVAKVAP